MGRGKCFCVLLGLVLALLQVMGEVAISAEKPVVFFGINLRYNPRTVYSRYQPLMDYLTNNTPYRFELRIARDYGEALRDLKEGRTLISSLGDGATIDAMLMYGAIPIVKPLNRDGEPFYRAGFVVLNDSPITSLQQLEGKRFVFGSHHSISGNLIPRFVLQRAGIDVRDLGSVTNLKNHDAVTKAMLKGQFDAGVVKDIFTAKYRPYGLRVVAYSASLPSMPLVVRRSAPEALKSSVARALLQLDPRNPAHRQIMSKWDEDFRYGFVSASLLDYRPLMGMFQKIPFGCGARCH